MILKKSGQRIGDWFLWIDCEVAKTDGYRKVPIVTLRNAISGGDILSTVVATRAMADELRRAADKIDQVVAYANEGQTKTAAEPKETT